ncbi:MAG: methyltransferase family protein, partial [Candidatus Angelobacter sp.]
FPGYAAYASRVPRLLPLRRRSNLAQDKENRGAFSRELYMKHREYNAALGSVVMLGVLILKMMLVQH